MPENPKTESSDSAASMSRYRQVMREWPRLFANSSGDGMRLLTTDAEIAAAQLQAAQRLAAEGLPVSYSAVGVMYEDQYFLVLRDAVEFPDRSLGTYVRVVHRRQPHAGVAIIPVCAGKVVLVRHFRHATRQWYWEIPRGFSQPGAPEQSAITELREEIGAVPRHITHLGIYLPDSSILAGEVHVFLAEVDACRVVEGREAISQLRQVDLDEMAKMISAGDISDGFTLAAMALFHARNTAMAS